MESSILFKDETGQRIAYSTTTLHDLNLDKFVNDIVSLYDIKETSTFYCREAGFEAILFRQAVYADLKAPEIRKIMDKFLTLYRTHKVNLENRRAVDQRQSSQKWLLDAAYLFCSAISGLDADLDRVNYKSDGLGRFHRALKDYINTEEYALLYSDTVKCFDEISSIRYSMEFDRYTVVISEDTDSKDFCEDLKTTFGRYECPAFESQIPPLPDINICDLELMILEALLKNYPSVTGTLEIYSKTHKSFSCELIERFLPELQFYLACIDYIKDLSIRGYRFCVPEIKSKSEFYIEGLYDLSLSAELESNSIETNDFYVKDHEKAFIFTGPNRSGKTAYARALGQVFYLASLGLPIPCSRAVLPDFSGLYTHFSHEEDLSNNYGRLKEELVRLHEIMCSLQEGSIVVMNDVFASTASSDAYEISKKVIEKLISLGCICLFVTNNNEIAELHTNSVLLTAGGDTKRSFSISRSDETNRSASNNILLNYKLDYESVMKKIRLVV